MRSWQMQAGVSAEAFRKYDNKPVIQGDSLASAILDQWKLYVFGILYSVALLILLLLDNTLQTWLSLFMLFIFVWT